jgi:hypothetical protein
MNRKSFWISIVAVVISFAGGFILANALNRSEVETLRAENSRLKTDSAVWEQQNRKRLCRKVKSGSA